MCSDGIEPDAVTYILLMDYLCKNGRCTEARKIFDSMVKRGLKPDVTTYGTLLSGYASKGAPVEMHDLLDLMTRNGIQLDHHVFNVLICTNTKQEKVDEVMLVFSKVRQQGLTPNAVNYGTVIDGLCKLDWTYNIMIDALLKFGRKDEAKDLFAALPANGLVPDDCTYRLMLENLIEQGLLEKLDDLFLSMEDNGCTADSRTLNCIVRKLLHKREVGKAGVYLSKIDQNNFHLEASTAELLVSNREYDQYMKFLPEKYRFVLKSRAV
uniref:Pentacotripeptide-repeat region of PRORP domain-containing protein n=1 Tax=Oryza punctata TaxID=4537 RepID=A0A0E0M9D7_ORYPU